MIDDREWNAIRGLVQSELAKIGSAFLIGEVVKVNKKKGWVYVKELGDVPVKLAYVPMTVKYYDEGADGSLHKKQAKVMPWIPQRGESVLIAQYMGQRDLPHCIGRIFDKPPASWLEAETV